MLALALGPAAAEAACAPQDIEIKTWSWNRDAGWFTIAGELVNHCAEPTGAQIQFTLRDAAGQVVSVEDAWVGGNRNVRPGETYSFKLSTRGYATAKDIAIRVTNVRQWPVR